jgi:predicted esterase
MRRALAGLLCLALFTPARSEAQQDAAGRYELGRRLRALENAVDARPDVEARRRALPDLKKAAYAFLLSGQPGEAGRLVDRARRSLEGASAPDPAAAWAESLALRPGARLCDSAAGALPFTLAPFYSAPQGRPDGARLRLMLCNAEGKAVTGAAVFPVNALPTTGEFSLEGARAGDYRLRAEIVVADRALARWDMVVSLAARVGPRLAALEVVVRALPDGPRTVDMETLRSLTALLSRLRGGDAPETNYPAARLLAEAEGLAEALRSGKAYYGPKRPGEFWLTLPSGGGGTPVRVLVPEAAREGKPVPLVVALHGAGGSENMFFDAHGSGLLARLCAERGWMLAAPRGGLPPGLLGELRKICPVDEKHVFLLGHSLGAARAVASACGEPGRAAAVAALAGCGAVEASEALRDVPFFVGVGREDFALAGARGLRDALREAGVTTVEYREYPDVEHVLVIQLGLRDVFAFFDRAARR